jgi:hypothetical protein
MAPRALLAGLGAGIASAILVLAATGGAFGLRFLLSFLALQPGMLAGLGWGWQAALVSALTGASVMLVAAGLREALVLLATVGLPVALLCYLASLNRAVPPSRETPDGVEWYPVGRIVAGATLFAAALSVALALYLASDLEASKAGLRRFVERVFSEPLPGADVKPPDAAQLARFASVMHTVMPAAAAVSWLSSFVFNLWLAGRITRAAGNLFRPWPDLAAMTYPKGFPLLLAGGLLATAGGEAVALVGAGVAGATLLAYAFLGLAILHYVTRGLAARTLILSAFYGAMIILNGWLLLLVALVGLMEPFSPWRRKPAPPPST